MLWILSFAENLSKNIGKNITNTLSGKYSPESIDHTKKCAADAFKTDSKDQFRKQQKKLLI